MAAIDQLIAQGGGQQFDPLATVGRVTQLQNLLLQGQAAQTQNQTAQLENQQRQQQYSDTQALRQAYQGAYNPQTGAVDTNKLFATMAQNGLGHMIPQIAQQNVAMREAALKLTEEQQKVEQGKAQQLASILGPVVNAPPQAKAQAYQVARNQAIQSRLIDPNDQSVPPQYTPEMDSWLDAHYHAAITANDQLGQVQKAKEFAEQQRHNQVMETNSVPLDKQVAKSWLAQHPGKTLADFNEYNKKLVPTTTFNLQNGGLNGQNGQPSAVAQSIANGQMKWSDAVSARTAMPVKEALLREVKSINPNFNSGDFTVEQKVREKYTSGNVSDQLLAIGTAREHMKLFSQLASALDNGNVQAANKIGNAFGVQFGSDKATNFRIASQAFGGEVGKAFDGAGVTEGERKSASSSYNENMGNQQFQGAVKTVDALLAGKQKAANDAYSAGTQGKPNFGNTGTEGAISVTDPRGHVHTFKDQASADNFKKLAGIK